MRIEQTPDGIKLTVEDEGDYWKQGDLSCPLHDYMDGTCALLDTMHDHRMEGCINEAGEYESPICPVSHDGSGERGTFRIHKNCPLKGRIVIVELKHAKRT